MPGVKGGERGGRREGAKGAGAAYRKNRRGGDEIGGIGRWSRDRSI